MQQHVFVAVAVHVADAGELPVGAALEGDGAAFGLDGGAAVHGVVHPAAVHVAEEDVVHSVAVEVADGAGEAFDRLMSRLDAAEMLASPPVWGGEEAGDFKRGVGPDR